METAQAIRFRPVMGRRIVHVAKDTARGEHSYSRRVLCGRVRGSVHIDSSPTAAWPSPAAPLIGVITCGPCARRYQKEVA